MTWVRLDEHFFAHPKVIDLSKEAKLLYMATLTYCSEHLTDGRISPAALRMAAALVDVPAASAAELVQAGLWEPTDGAYQVHDYLDYQPPARTVRRNRLEARDRMRALRDSANDNGTSDDVRANFAETSQEPKRLPIRIRKPVRGPVPEDVSVPSEPQAASAAASVPDPVDWVFDYYREYVQPLARLCPREKIRARLKRFSVDELTLGIEHFAADAWWMEHNGTRGAPWFFHSDARSEQFLNLEPQGPADKPPWGRHDG